MSLRAARAVTHASDEKTPQSRKRRIGMWLFLPFAPVLLGSSAFAWLMLPTWTNPYSHLVTYKVRYDNLLMAIEGTGAVESSVNCDIICKAKSGQRGAIHATTLKWLVEDGATVKRGAVITELDSSGLEESLKVEQIALWQAQAAWTQSEENLKIVRSQNEGDIETAKVALKLAELDLARYLHGDYLQARRDIEGRLALAESDTQLCRERVSWCERMVKKGYLASLQAQGEHARMEGADIALAKVHEELRVLEDYTKRKTQTELDSKRSEASRALHRVERQARAKLIQARIDARSKKSVYENQKKRVEDIDEQIRNCTITAPQDGIVVHYNSDQNRMGSGGQPMIAQGEPVREGQKLMQIPDLAKMQIETKVNEAALAHVQGEEWTSTGFGEAMQAALMAGPHCLSSLTAELAFDALHDRFRDQDRRLHFGGDRVVIRIHAFPDLVLHGHVKHVSSVPSQFEWMMADLKAYPTQVAIDEPVDGLKPGMTADVTILGESPLEHVLTAPVETLRGTLRPGQHCTCYVLTAHGPEERDVVVGMSNESMVHIRSGLTEGDQVVLNPDSLKGRED